MKKLRETASWILFISFSATCAVLTIMSILCLLCAVAGHQIFVWLLGFQIGGDTRLQSLGHFFLYCILATVFGFLAFYLPAKIDK